MATTPPVECQLPRVNKFVGEVFGVLSNARTIYAGSEQDTIKRDTRVILLIGPNTAGKTSLIDFFCNYFYGAELDSPTRYHIANEKFDKTTPKKEIITYIFNDSVMDVRPVLIDTPPTSGPHGEENRNILTQWIKDNESLELDAIGVVFLVSHRITTAEEEGLQKALELFPLPLRQKCVVFMIGSDGSSPAVGLLRRFNLEKADVYKVNTSCIFQRSEDEPLQEHLRGNYWRMSIANFNALFSRLNYKKPVVHSFSGQGSSSMMLRDSGTSSASSKNSLDTVIRRDPSSSATKSPTSTVTTTNQSNTMESTISHDDTPSYVSKEVIMVPGYKISNENTKRIESRHITSIYQYQYDIPEVQDIRSKDYHQPTATTTSLELSTITGKRQPLNNNGTMVLEESKTVLPSESSKNFSKTSSDKAFLANDDDVKRYVFDVSNRSHTLHYSDPVTYSRSVSNSPRVLRETTIDDPYDDVFGPPKETLIPVRHSWHEILPNNIARNPVNKAHQRKRPMETLIDFRSTVVHTGVFERHDSARRSRHASRTRSRSVEPQFFAQPIEIHRISPCNNFSGIHEHFGRQIRNGAIDMRENPVFSLRGRERNQTPPLFVAPDTSGSLVQRERSLQSHATTYKSNGRVPKRPYSNVVRVHSRGESESERSLDNEEMRMRKQEEMLKKTRKVVEREYYLNGAPQHKRNATTSIPHYDQCPDTDRNVDVLSKHMKSNNLPLIVQEQLNRKPYVEVSKSQDPYGASDYGDGAVMRGIDEGQPQLQLTEERYQNTDYPSEVQKNSERKPTSLPLPPYVHRPSQPPTQLSPEQILRGDIEYGGGETRLLKDVGIPHVKTKNIVATTKSTKHQPRQIRFLNWTPANCSNTRDCCLNCLFFFVAPLVVLFIIIAIVVTVAVG